MSNNKVKARAYRMQQCERERERIAISKSIRRHNHTPHGAERWGTLMGMLRNIHAEIAPLVKRNKEAEAFCYAYVIA